MSNQPEERDTINIDGHRPIDRSDITVKETLEDADIDMPTDIHTLILRELPSRIHSEQTNNQ
ncbi:MAG: hypothetical protein ACFCU5_12585 [Pleurocapsa sp.]